MHLLLVEDDLELGAPSSEPFFAFGQQLPHEGTKRLDQRAQRNVANDLVELAGDEIAPLANDGFVQLLDQRGLPDARIARDQHDRRPRVGALANSIERGQERCHFRLAAVKLLRDDELVADVVQSKGKARNVPARGPLVRAMLEVLAQSGGASIAILR